MEGLTMNTTINTKCDQCGGNGTQPAEVPVATVAMLVAMMADSDHRKIEAITFLRASVPAVGLKEAKGYVEGTIMTMSKLVINNTWTSNRGWKTGFERVT